MTRFALCWDWIVFKFFCPTPLTEKHPEYKQILMELKTGKFIIVEMLK